jgi:hypothetical protein
VRTKKLTHLLLEEYDGITWIYFVNTPYLNQILTYRSNVKIQFTQKLCSALAKAMAFSLDEMRFKYLTWAPLDRVSEKRESFG